MTEQPVLISLPVGTNKRGLHLAPPHGSLVWDGRKTAVAKARPFDLSGPWILLSGGKAYGTIEVGLPEAVAVDAFDARFHEHRVTTKERERWWRDATELYLSPILRFEQFDEPLEIQVVPGMQTVVEEVCFVGQEPTGLEGYCKGVSERLSIIAGFMEQMPQELADSKAQDSSEEDETMPYSVDKPPKRISGLPAAAQRIWVRAFNAAHNKYRGDEARCNRIAWGAVKNAGYYQDEDGNWHKRKKELGEGQGVDGPQQGIGGTDTCVCPKCNEKAAHERGTPCSEQKCPACGSQMAGAAAKVEDMEEDDEKAAGPADSAADQQAAMVEASLDGDVEPCPAESEDSGNWLKEWLKGQFAAVLSGLRGTDDANELASEPLETRFKTFTARDGRQWLLTWTTNAFEDREGEIFRTKAIADYVARHAADEKKGEFWFWHMPGAKFADILWQAPVGRFLAEAGPFDDTPIGSQFAAFFADYPHDHPTIAPEGWGTSHGFHYLSGDRKDAVYDWFEKFETTVLPKSAASNQHSPQMEVLPMNAQQEKALEEIGGAELVKMVLETGEGSTKDLEEQGVAFKETEAADTEAQLDVEAVEEKAAPQETQEDASEKAVETDGGEVVEDDVDSGAKGGTEELVQQIVAGLNLGGLLAAVQKQQEMIAGIGEQLTAVVTRVKALEDMGVAEDAPLANLWPRTAMRASRAAQTSTEEAAEKQQPQVPDAISHMAQRIPM